MGESALQPDDSGEWLNRAEPKRAQNERRFGSWQDLCSGGRRYWYDVAGHFGWRARYVKEVDAQEVTLKFYQEIFNERGELVEVHEKYPVDRGHRAVHKEGEEW